MPDNHTAVNESIASYLSSLKGRELLINLDWQTFLKIDRPFAQTRFSEKEVQARYARNGHDWDIHGTLYVPASHTFPGYSFILIHGGGVNELDFQATPDGRPGLARVLASQGFQVLTPSYPGLWPLGGRWQAAITERRPRYLLDREMTDDECRDRLLKATYKVYMQGIAALVEQNLAGEKIFAMGHSTGGPMAADLYGYLHKAKIAGIVGWGSGAYDLWIRQWRESIGTQPWGVAARYKNRALGSILYRTVEEYRHHSGYEDPPELTPWGGMEQRFELGRGSTPMFNPDLQVTSHNGDLQRLGEYQKATGLPLEEYVGQLKEPSPEFLRGIKVLLLVGENDRTHWKRGGQGPETQQESFVAKRYAEKTKGAHLVVVPKYAHMGHWSLHNEKLAYLWLWAIKDGYFGELH
jgi:predicted esterase